MPNINDVVITAEILNKISKIDEFLGSWKEGVLKIPKIKLNSMKRLATIESIGSSNRIEGNKLQDSEIEKLFNNVRKKSFASRDEQEVVGYADLINIIFENYSTTPLSENYIKHFHKILLNHSSKDERHKGEYKKDTNRVAAFDSNGKEVGTIFETATPFDTPRLMSELVKWTNDTLEDNFFHPIITIGIFIVHFLSIHPFTDGNGRLSRALTNFLLLKSGYSYMPYASMESIIEKNKDAYYRALRETQKTIWKNKINYTPWLSFFVSSLEKQLNVLKEKLKEYNQIGDDNLSPLAYKILEFFSDSEELSVSQIVDKTSKNSETVRKVIYNLAKKGYLKKIGTTNRAVYIKVKSK